MKHNRKKAILSAFALLALFTVKAQDYVRPGGSYTPSTDNNPTATGPKKFSLSLSMGSAIPLKDYASTYVKGSFWDFNSPDSTHLQGFAQSGFNMNVTASYLFSDEFGIKMMLGYSSNPFNINTFSATVGFPSYASTQTNYHVTEYMIGPYMSLLVAPKLRVELGAMIGLVTISYPEIVVALNDTLTDTYDFNGGNGFGYCFDAGAEYSITSNLSILINVAYTGSTIKYNGFDETLNSPGYYPYTFSHDTDVPYMTTAIIKPTIGIALKF
jgi:hypothetical protein